MKYLKMGALALVLSPVAAFAAAPDVTAVTTALTDSSTSIATIGAAVLVVVVGIATYKWLRRAI